ncbi:MAG TPA: DUF1365 domain-containing protein [Geminicoccus sp.]|jgi:hypothetical protein|uniref:DUF1365 domain-containing protein n=1 Tax=Geminicoccus sp. TaxID=2024832 RepID=UPI002E2FE572|nr:DUF1365 domain-containing protein [Geminicoccus sp.]HEX2528057.1 DUF1365 domain-containing protein [Geminicoccus sp.]
MPIACLYRGWVMHCRMRPFRHRFAYRVFSILLDIDRPDDRPATRLFSIGRANLFSWHASDHGPRDGSPLRPWVDDRLRAANRPHMGRTVWMACFPRVLGYVFDPLSVYFVYAGAQLETVIYEVKNTFGRQHAYVLPAMADGDGVIRHGADKDFFVSPFIGMTARYRFRVAPPEQRFSLAIRQTVPEGLQLLASQTGERWPLSDRELLRALVWAGPVTFKVITGIHWEALRLWWRGAAFGGPSTVPVDKGGTSRR